MIPKDLRIPGYDIEVLLGKGGMAAVYQARQQSFGREVALKILSPSVEDLDDFSKRFLRESLIVAKLHHSNIVQVYDVGQYENHFYISMEYLHGSDLSSKLRSGLKLRESLKIIQQLADALDFAHRKNIIHRDIKPENILFREDGAAVLTDFGIAKELESQADLTQAGVIIGTPKYMSPEQLRGEEVDHRADLYSLGVVFYRCLTNHVPFDGKDMVATAYLQNNEPVPELPDEVKCFKPIIERLLEKSPEDRYQRGKEVVDDLEALDRQMTIPDITNLYVAAVTKVPLTITSSASGKFPKKAESSKREGDPKVCAAGTQIRLPAGRVKTVMAEHIPSSDAESSFADFANFDGQDTSQLSPASTQDHKSGFLQYVRVEWLAAALLIGLSLSLNFYRSDEPGGHIGARMGDWSQHVTSLFQQSFLQLTSDASANDVIPESDVMDLALLQSENITIEDWDDDPLNEVVLKEADAERQQTDTFIQGLLQEANTLMQRHRYRRPENNNAFVLYEKILALDPYNKDALDGLKRMADAYASMAEKAITLGKIEEAERHIADLRIVQPSRPALVRLNRMLDELIVLQKNEEVVLAERNRLRLIEELLDAAQKDEKMGRIRSPFGNNALEKYQKVLDLDPGNSAAISKLVEYGR